MAQRAQSNRSRNSKSSSDQPLMSHWTETAKDHPLTTAAAAAGAAAAGVFLWSRRNQISDQISRFSDQIGHFAEGFRSSGSSRELALTEGPNELSAIESSRATSKRGRTTASKSRGGDRTAKARTTAGRAVPQSTTM